MHGGGRNVHSVERANWTSLRWSHWRMGQSLVRDSRRIIHSSDSEEVSSFFWKNMFSWLLTRTLLGLNFPGFAMMLWWTLMPSWPLKRAWERLPLLWWTSKRMWSKQSLDWPPSTSTSRVDSARHVAKDVTGWIRWCGDSVSAKNPSVEFPLNILYCIRFLYLSGRQCQGRRNRSPVGTEQANWRSYHLCFGRWSCLARSRLDPSLPTRIGGSICGLSRQTRQSSQCCLSIGHIDKITLASTSTLSIHSFIQIRI